MTDKQIDELIEAALRDEQRLPEGFSRRLEQRIDALTAQEKPVAKHRRRLGWRTGAAAVSAAVLTSVLVLRPEPPMADTYTDPAEAAEAVTRALALLSTHYNEGLDRVAVATARINEANTLLFKTIQKEQP
jgi:hypothetical protein